MAGLLAAAAIASLGSSALAASGSGTGRREIVSDRWTSTTPGTSTGRHYAATFVDPADPAGKPPAVSHVHLQLPPGARFNTNALPQCTASDAQLMLQGPAACPAGSRVGTMAISFDTGLPAPLSTLNATVTFLNARNQLIFLSQDSSSGSRLVSRATVTAHSLDSDLPLLPGTPPDGAADRTERATFLSASTARGNYLTTPPTCPADHRWVERETYTYRDGVTQSVEIAEPCRPRRASHRRTPHRHRKPRAPARGRHPDSRNDP